MRAGELQGRRFVSNKEASVCFIENNQQKISKSLRPFCPENEIHMILFFFYYVSTGLRTLFSFFFAPSSLPFLSFFLSLPLCPSPPLLPSFLPSLLVSSQVQRCKNGITPEGSGRPCFSACCVPLVFLPGNSLDDF